MVLEWEQFSGTALWNLKGGGLKVPFFSCFFIPHLLFWCVSRVKYLCLFVKEQDSGWLALDTHLYKGQQMKHESKIQPGLESKVARSTRANTIKGRRKVIVMKITSIFSVLPTVFVLGLVAVACCTSFHWPILLTIIIRQFVFSTTKKGGKQNLGLVCGV